MAPASVTALYQSVNVTQVLLPGRNSETASAVLVAVQAGAGLRVLIALHLPSTGEHVVYVHDGGPLVGQAAREVAAEALAFVESMGFFMENVSWRELDPVSQRELLASLKVFQPPVVQPKAASAERVVDPRVKLARLLVQI